MQNLANVAGSYPRIRIGGSTANRATYVSDQEQAILLNFTTPGADQPTSLTWGPSWLRGFDVLPSKVKYTLGLPFNSGAAGEEHTLASAKAAYGGLKDKLYAFQIGNEFDGKEKKSSLSRIPRRVSSSFSNVLTISHASVFVGCSVSG